MSDTLSSPRYLVLAGLLLSVSLWFPARSAQAHPETQVRIDALTADLSKNPDQPKLYMERGRLHLEHSRYKEALRDFDEAMKRSPSFKEPLIYRGLACFQSGDQARGLDDLNRYIREGRPYHLAFSTRADIRSGMGDLKGAAEDLAEASRLRPLPEQYDKRAKLYVKLGDLDSAAKSYEEGIAALNSPVALVLDLLTLESSRGNRDAALKWVGVLEARGERKERCFNLRGAILKRADRKKESQAAYAEALRLVDRRLSKRASDYALLDKAEALLGLERDDQARDVLKTISPASRQLPEYRTLARQLKARPKESQTRTVDPARQSDGKTRTAKEDKSP